MRYYRYSEDWVTYLDGEFRSALINTLRGLDLTRLQKYPPPKVAGLPFGNETRVFSRFLRGKSSQLDASAFYRVYRSAMPSEMDLLYGMFRENLFLPRALWLKVLDEETVELWIDKKCLHADATGSLRCEFSVICLDDLLLVTDPLKDHGPLWEPDFIVEDGDRNGSEDVRPFFHVYIGLDSLRMIEVMEGGRLPSRGRYLDCGPGSGGLLLYFGRRYDQALGIDINPRAVVLSTFNAELNGLPDVKAECHDALDLAGNYGRFDLISWNLPFIFMPEDDRHNYIDAFGGELGIGLCLDFIRTLPAIMTDRCVAYIAALAPITLKGKNVLEARLGAMLTELRLDCDVQVAQVSVANSKELWDFHRSFGLDKFESVYLRLSPGEGNLTRTEVPFSRAIVDAMREKLYRRRFA